MFYGTAIVFKPRTESHKQEGLYAQSLECNIGAFGESILEASTKLAGLVARHISMARESGICPFVPTEPKICRDDRDDGYTKLWDYYSKHNKFPPVQQVRNEDVNLVAYDLTQ